MNAEAWSIALWAVRWSDRSNRSKSRPSEETDLGLGGQESHQGPTVARCGAAQTCLSSRWELCPPTGRCPLSGGGTADRELARGQLVSLDGLGCSLYWVMGILVRDGPLCNGMDLAGSTCFRHQLRGSYVAKRPMQLIKFGSPTLKKSLFWVHLSPCRAEVETAPCWVFTSFFKVGHRTTI